MDKKIQLIKELVHDWANEIINAEAAMFALSMIVNPKKPSKECSKWATKTIENLEERK